MLIKNPFIKAPQAVDYSTFCGILYGDMIGNKGIPSDETVFALASAALLSTITGGKLHTKALKNWREQNSYGFESGKMFQKMYNDMPNLGYGGMFANWASNRSNTVLESFGNGCLAKVSTVVAFRDTTKGINGQLQDSIEYLYGSDGGLMYRTNCYKAGMLCESFALAWLKAIQEGKIDSLLQFRVGQTYQEVIVGEAKMYSLSDTIERTLDILELASYGLNEKVADRILNASLCDVDADTVTSLTTAIVNSLMPRDSKKIEYVEDKMKSKTVKNLLTPEVLNFFNDVKELDKTV
jgi:hypothetical protein